MSNEGPPSDPHRRCDYVCLTAQNARAEVTHLRAERAQLIKELATALDLLNEQKLKTLEICTSMQRLHLRGLC